MSTSIAAPTMAAPTHALRKAAVFVAALAATSAGVYAGTTALASHATQPDTTVSYATPDAIARTIQGANHTPATAGDFIDAASISTPDVVSVIVAVP